VRRIGVRAAFLLLAALQAALPAAGAEPRVITDATQSARPAALHILKHLAAGELESAAALSNAPERRLEVLRQFRESVGEERFRALFSRYFSPENRIVMEAAVGAHRLLVWDLGEAGHELTGQYFVELDGGFVMDDVPNTQRYALQRFLADFRSSK
jgi:hypothetical protein